MAPLQGWDESFYVSQLTSAVRDHDLMLQDDLLLVPSSFGETLRVLTSLGPGGALDNTFGIGPAVLHSAYAWPVLAGTRGALSPKLRPLLACASLVLLTVLALACVELLTLFELPFWTSLLATSLAILSGPLALYGTRYTLGSHLPAAVWVTLLLLSSVRYERRASSLGAAFMGFSAGMLVITRWQDAVLGLPALVALLWPQPGLKWSRKLWSLLCAASCFAAILGIQLSSWRVQFGSWLTVPQGGAYLSWVHPRLGAFLLSPYHGSVPWAPGAILGIVAVSFLLERPRRFERAFAVALLGSCLLTVYVSSLPRDWWGGDSFGPRRLASLVPAVALGLAALLKRLRPAPRAAVAGALGGWAVFVASASLSGFDDLTLLFFGRLSADDPRSLASYAGTAWRDPWKAAFFLKPGFTFTDTPRNADRILGMLAVIGLVALTLALWRMLLTNRRLRAGFLGLGLAWVAAWLLLTNAWMPRQGPANQAWDLVVCGLPDQIGTLPPGVQEAGHLVLATYAAAGGNEDVVLEQLRFVGPLTGYVVPSRTLLAFGRDSQGLAAIRAAQRRGCSASGIGEAALP
jgi:hypothetical protein